MSSIASHGRCFVSVLLAAAVIAGCSSAPTEPYPSISGNVVNPERGSRGNPVYYEVLGRRYYVLDSSDGFREKGVASWYGRDFHGRATSSGEVYDMNKLTAAHKTLPIPTWVSVTNLDNGRQVIVKVNDRGPFVKGRIIDLSQRAAEELGMLKTGTANVEVRALGAPAASPPAAGPPAAILASTPAASPAPSPVPAPAEPQRRGFSLISSAEAATLRPEEHSFRPVYVQVGAFSDRNNAARLMKRLKDSGIKNSFVLTSGSGREQLHRVRIGPIEDPGEFDEIRSELSAAGLSDARLVEAD